MNLIQWTLMSPWKPPKDIPFSSLSSCIVDRLNYDLQIILPPHLRQRPIGKFSGFAMILSFYPAAGHSGTGKCGGKIYINNQGLTGK